MGKRFGRNQRRRMREEIADLHSAAEKLRGWQQLSEERARRLADQLRRSIVIEVVDRAPSFERDELPIRVEARFNEAVMTYQHSIPHHEFLVHNLRDPRIGADYSLRLAEMIFEKFPGVHHGLDKGRQLG